ncbi:hypothetical protein [Vibrio taketomensis]|uniref:hypothetical protein n=1 Tax=Vibrio taketomensis TaxID=2572923 RepID=UPI0013893DB7|nr:hypothetical protein [Vibrio taketomensis]
MTEFDDLYNKIRFVDLYSYQKQVGYSSLAVSILVELYKSIMEPTLLSATKCYGNLSSIGDENPEIQHLKRVKFWSDLGFSVSQGGHEDNPRMVCLLQNLSISPNAKDVSQEFYKFRTTYDNYWNVVTVMFEALCGLFSASYRGLCSFMQFLFN